MINFLKVKLNALHCANKIFHQNAIFLYSVFLLKKLLADFFNFFATLFNLLNIQLQNIY